MKRKEAIRAIEKEFAKLSGYALALRPNSEVFDHVTMVAHKSETAEEAAKAIWESARVK